ncbi:LacI family DNA-binding transcriptional regulator [Clostridium saccharoperbutylacetonicum]|uniref:HTH-type transcriptional regulator RegA n=1 Tax=Clostridium saccharoperbutylacetonicum N1-4(HMT) TaxID=931276 RepID=M1MBV6_9CLOT|nr:LacI family DNA-binding transcriptional regulator [Clostridium saccharoperbutylacetonicum]AGF55414.1 HTH-type transcriptional regulator RegA [Clostridium saccharoperbutylacetonicum N1-4(HMT)]AQR94312.1 catabolite control protein A [Clostridium saccharoperbutylacetonicum]NRT63872.1 LacI family transcriptional regulator [Clostridium saccharoperbutylacetonicum]NSB27237.1 LacI family transcriptional regulator [Clostridium saccharoperbutylacetonicum]NSB30012.1 LacI family transcriptional regulat
MSATISDIARRAKVSPATVSRVLNSSGYVKEDTKQRILTAIKEMNYTPSAIARSLSKSETNTIGIIVPDITNTYFGEIIKGVSEIAEKSNLNIILFNTDNYLEKEIRAINLLKEQRIKGIIMTPGFGEEKFNETYLKTITSLNVPIILVSADIKFTQLNGVFVDNIKGGYDATNLLIKEGHNKIGIMTGLLSSEPTTDMLEGYKKALFDNNIKLNKNYIYHGEFKLEKAYELTKKMLCEDDPPTALFVCSNMMTMGVIKALKEEHKDIPKDLAIVGFNKIDLLDIVGINITYMEDSPLELGRAAMEMLSQIFSDAEMTDIRRMIISPQIIIRGSEKKL